MATLPGPRTWATNDEPTASMFNADLRDAYGFFWNVPRVRVYKSTSQSLADDTATVLTWDSEVFDSDGMHEPTTHPTRLTVVTAGIYEITVHIEWQIVSDGTDVNTDHRYAGIFKNNNGGTTWVSSACVGYDHQLQTNNDASGAPQTNHFSIFKECAANDYFEVLAEHIANRSVTTHEITNSRTFFSMLWMGTV